MTLEEAALDQAVCVEEFKGLNEKDLACLLGMGFRLGALVTKVIPTPLRDPVECLVGSQLLAVERRLFKHIFVTPLDAISAN